MLYGKKTYSFPFVSKTWQVYITLVTKVIQSSSRLGQLVMLCQLQGCHSPCYKAMNHKNDFESIRPSIILRQKTLIVLRVQFHLPAATSDICAGSWKPAPCRWTAERETQNTGEWSHRWVKPQLLRQNTAIWVSLCCHSVPQLDVPKTYKHSSHVGDSEQRAERQSDILSCSENDSHPNTEETAHHLQRLPQR